MESYPKNNNNTNVVAILKEIYSSSGKNKQAWEDLLLSIYQSSSYKDIISFFIQIIRNEPSNIITLDIIDFLIDYGPKNLVKEISSIDFMNNIVNLLKKSSGSGLEVQKKFIYLAKKWNEKANEFKNENFEGFVHIYKELNQKGICFPPSGYKIFTYELYFSDVEANTARNKAAESIFRNEDINQIMSRYVNNQQNNNLNSDNNFIQNNSDNFNNHNNNINFFLHFSLRKIIFMEKNEKS
jgi:hypothetical protein